MEFRFIKRKRNSALIDKQHIVSWRQNYIKNIRELREEGRPIYYLDETWYNCGDVVNKLWVDTKVTSPRNAEERRLSTGLPAPANKGKRLIILHIGSEDGFLPGGLLCFESKKNTADYHNEMNGDTFFEWFKKILPTLRDRAVIVMDHAPYHSVIKEPHPKLIWKKARIVEWLQGKGETIDADPVKTQLLDIAEKYRQPGKIYAVNEYAKEHEKLVLCLPPYHCELNPIELAWAQPGSHARPELSSSSPDTRSTGVNSRKTTRDAYNYSDGRYSESKKRECGNN
ncbi:uncharacterized protein LOC143218186 [Lasioglossum baleicum]|uniref:uncharacterized protein LOC143218186 n=1 Tax=Lasioglossum baleicum TaxID=434251 RepID=UPI003FCE0E74